jgi:hypothetical protein
MIAANYLVWPKLPSFFALADIPLHQQFDIQTPSDSQNQG